MKHFDISDEKKHEGNSFEFNNALDQVLREGARRLLAQAIENEINEYVEQNKDLLDADNKRLVTRNGYLPRRKIQTGLGLVDVKQPRIRNGCVGEKFVSSILPPYLRRTPSVESVIPALYLKGIASGSFTEALESILGKNAKGLSPTNIVRLKNCWEEEYKNWNKRDLSEKKYVYMWGDGIYFNVRLQSDRPCLLILIGALSDGRKELVAIHDGHRESKISWKEVLEDLKLRGLSEGPSLAIGDGALGFWSALEEVFPSTKQQRCWVHKTANILDKMPKSVQGNAKKMIHEMYMSPSKDLALKSFGCFIRVYGSKYPKACKCLEKGKDRLFTFYDYPAEHWQHIRTTNPIESTFATVRHRTRQTKGCGSRKATLSMVFKLARSAEKKWRKLKGCKLIEKIIQGVKFKDGEEVKNVKIAA